MKNEDFARLGRNFKAMVNGSEEKLNSLIISFFVLFFLVVQERTAGGLVSVTRVKYYAPDKEERMERGKKIDLLLQENIRREKEKKEAEKRRQQKEEEEEILRR